MRIFLTLFYFSTALVLITNGQDDAETIENTGDSSEPSPIEGSSGGSSTSNTETEATTTTTTTTTTTPAPVGSSKRFSFSSASGGFSSSININFVQGADNNLEMQCSISTPASASDSLEKFCMPTSDEDKPKIYLVKGFTDCSGITGQDSVEAILVATLNKPNDNAVEHPTNFKYNDLEGNCLTVMQKKTNRRGGRQDDSGSSSADDSSSDSSSSDASSSSSDSGTPAAVVDDGGCSAYLATTTTTTEASSADSGSSDTSSSDPSDSGRRSGRLIMPRVQTRTFNTINLGTFTILSTGSVFVAPTIVQSNAGPVTFTAGSFTTYTYNPWSTLPYLQLPGWTVSSIYTIVGGLFLLYIIGLAGAQIPGVGEFFDTVKAVTSRNALTQRFNRVFTSVVDRSFDGLTEFVHSGINKFKRRNFYSKYYNHDNRRTEADYDYYEAAEQAYFKK